MVLGSAIQREDGFSTEFTPYQKELTDSRLRGNDRGDEGIKKIDRGGNDREENEGNKTMHHVKKITLPNGLRVLLAPQPQGLAASVLILVAAGSEYETKKINGVSHFLEHMAFKGTMNRPRVGQISEELDALGAVSNAFTDQEVTGYYAKVEAKKLPATLDIITDIYLNPVFVPEEIEKERAVIIEEINMDEDRLPRKASELFISLLYGDQPAGWNVAGSKEILKKIFKNDIERYREARYVMRGTVAAIAGKFNEAAVMRQIRAAFAHFPKGRAAAKSKTVERQKKPAVSANYRESGQSHLVLGFRAFSRFDPRRYALQVAADVLGGGMSSRLFKRVREELAAAYYVGAGAALSLDHGHFQISAGVDHAKTEIVVRAILEECRRLRDEEVGEKELRRSKDHMIGGLILGLEASDDLAMFYGTQEILAKRILSPEQMIAMIRKVTAADVRAAIRDIFRNDRLNLAIVGPHRNSKVLEKILKL
jgi:predicted Zn-dependent peptidase